MGISIDFISHLPMELQEDILKLMSMKEGKDHPIEIDDNVYFVEKPVSDLVKQLTKKCIKCEEQLESEHGIQKD